MYKCLSYPINKTAPGWPGNPTLEIIPLSLITQGQVADTYNLILFNHFGSHMDGPKHFTKTGLRLSELPLDAFIYQKPLLIDIPKSFGELITVEDLLPYESDIKESDLLMIRSGFSVYRVNQPERYAGEGPALSSEAAKYMIENFNNLKAVAVDWISLASYAHAQDGQLAHQYLLGEFHDHYICIIEDVNFEGLIPHKIKRVFSIPLFIDEVDSAPITMFAELDA
ncbi:MAG: arylformamidase [Clostridiales bacterium]|jgi:kynurenine formamidase|nr:arylformamidase [Clostridiales bacterium]MDK2934309.1 arylformamidase [Clostridiales bacterium]